MVNIEPKFEIDEKGRVICQRHSNYSFFKDPEIHKYHPQLLEKQLTCKTCDHYKNNDCYFSKLRIDQIEYKRTKKRKGYICKLCGNKIDRMLTIIHKSYHKEKYNVNIPLICCACYEALRKNKYMESNRFRSKIFLYNALYSVYSLISIFFFLLIYHIGIFYLIIFLFPIFYLLFINLKKRKQLKDGLKYYQDIFSKSTEEKDFEKVKK